MEHKIRSDNGKVSYADYVRVIEEYLIAALGKRSITKIDYKALDQLDAKRIEQMGKVPSQSTMLTHNATLNRVFNETVILCGKTAPKSEDYKMTQTATLTHQQLQHVLDYTRTRRHNRLNRTIILLTH